MRIDPYVDLGLLEKQRREAMARIHDVPPYDPEKFGDISSKELVALRHYNSQWTKLHQTAPLIRERLQYLENAVTLPVGPEEVLFQAGAIVPTTSEARHNRLKIAIGAGKHGTKDQLVALRPAYAKKGTGPKGKKTAYPTQTHVPPSLTHRGSGTANIGWLVFILRHRHFDPTCPVMYKPVQWEVTAHAQPGETRLVSAQDVENDSLVTQGGQELQDMAIDAFNEVWKTEPHRNEVLLTFPGFTQDRLADGVTDYSLWYPDNIALHIDAGGMAYEHRSKEFEAYLKSGRQHYDNNYEREFAAFGLDKNGEKK